MGLIDLQDPIQSAVIIEIAFFIMHTKKRRV
jgi:hypothetical protein